MILGELSRPVPAGINVAQLEACMLRRRPPLDFPAHIERCYEADRGGLRSDLLFRMSPIGFAIYAGLVLASLMMFADIRPLVNRTALVGVPLFLALTCVFLLKPNRMLRELAVVLQVLTGAVTLSYLALHTASPDRWVIPQTWILALLYITALQRLRFIYVVLTCLLLCPLNLYVMLHLPQYTPATYIAGMMLLLTGSVFVALSTYNTELQQRQTYLLTLKARLQARDLELLSKCDPLTGLSNRLLLGEMIEKCRQQPQYNYSILLLDIDHFKALNDAAGHEAGDLCLVQVASLIQKELRGSHDHAFRYGGEEFLILLRETAMPEAIVVAERIRTSLAAMAIRNPGVGTGNRVTASIGVASNSADAHLDGEKLIAVADAALYAAKQGGRNRVFTGRHGPEGVLQVAGALPSQGR